MYIYIVYICTVITNVLKEGLLLTMEIVSKHVYNYKVQGFYESLR